MLFSQYKANRIAELLAEQWGADRIPGLLELIAHTKPSRVLEIGCWEGVSTEIFLLHAQSVVAVDPWPDEHVRRHFIARAGHYPHLIRIEGTSPEALADMAGAQFDMCYIDGDHSYTAVEKDIYACRRLLLPGGWMAGHDYGGTGTPDVQEVVLEEFENPLRFSDSSWAVQV